MDSETKPLPAAFWLVLALAAGLRLTGVGYGLPAVFNADEPHVVNVAVSFGRGNLNPHLFKYPTLWMYLLFAAYGVFFAFWSGFGRVRSVADFGKFFAWTPKPFFLIGRLMAAGFSCAALGPVYLAAEGWLSQTGALAAAGLLAVSPVLVEAAHATKPESLLFFWAALAWLFSGRYLQEGRRRDLIAAGAWCGLALSSQYTAAPLGSVVISSWLGRRAAGKNTGVAELLLACLAVPAFFLAGSPYIALDFHAFWETMRDIRQLESTVGSPVGLWIVVHNVLAFAGNGIVGAAALSVGTIVLARRDRGRALWLGLPVLAYVMLISRSSEGGWGRYLMAVFPALALLAASAVDACERAWGGTAARSAAALLTLAGLWGAVTYDRQVLLPDTRTLAADWIRANVPEGKTLLLDQEHASPRVRMSRETVRRMLEQTKAANHPRAKFYQYMLDGHPGGGYQVFRVLRDYKDLHSHPEHAAFSAVGQPMLDVRGGLEAATQAGVDFVVLTTFGADRERSPELSDFLDQVREEAEPVATFEPKPGESVGPRIEIYRLR